MYNTCTVEGQGQYIFTRNHIWKEINRRKAIKVKYYDGQYKSMKTFFFWEKGKYGKIDRCIEEWFPTHFLPL